MIRIFLTIWTVPFFIKKVTIAGKVIFPLNLIRRFIIIHHNWILSKLRVKSILIQSKGENYETPLNLIGPIIGGTVRLGSCLHIQLSRRKLMSS